MYDEQKYDRDWFYQHYYMNQLSVRVIAKIVGIRPKQAILELEKHNIELRTQGKIDADILLCEYEKNNDVSLLAEKFGVTKAAIYKSLKNSGVVFEQKKSLSEEKINECVSLYIEGNSIREVSKLTNIAVDTVGYWINKMGVSRSAAESLVKYPELYDQKTLQNLVDCGYSRQMIADKIGCSLSRLKVVLRNHKLSVNPINMVNKINTASVLAARTKSQINIDKNRLIDDYIISGKSAHSIALECGVATASIINKLKQYGIEVRGAVDHNDKLELIREGLKQGKSQCCIAKDLYISEATVRRMIKKYDLGININVTNDLLNNKMWLMEQLHIKTPEIIAKELNVRLGTISKYIRKYQIRGTMLSRFHRYSVEHCGLISDSMVEAVMSGEVGLKSANIEHVDKNNNLLMLSSSLEKQYAEQFDNDSDVVSYEYENKYIKYDSGSHIPDFHLNKVDGSIWVEVKHSAFMSHLLDGRIHQKFLALRDLCNSMNENGFIYTEKGQFDIKLIAASIENCDLSQYLSKEDIVEYLYNRGFLYPFIDIDLELRKSLEIAECLDFSAYSSHMHEVFYDHFFSSGRSNLLSIRDAFNNKDIIAMSVNRIDSVITERRILREMIRCGASVPSVFKPQIARFIYDRYNPSIIVDPFAGWGGRLIASIDRCYYGFDINRKTVLGGQKLMKYLMTRGKYNTEISLMDIFDNRRYPDCDMVFTSPPFGSEIYDGIKCAHLNDYIMAIVNMSCCLKRDGILAIHLPDKIECPDGFNNVEVIEIQNNKYFGCGTNVEYINVFKKSI